MFPKSKNRPAELNTETYLRIRDLPKDCRSIFAETGNSDTIQFKKEFTCNHPNNNNHGLLPAMLSNGLARKMGNNEGQSANFTCRRIFNANDGQEIVYKNVAFPIVQDALKGFNGTIFAYGQTGSGKTHTMQGTIGDQIDEGIISRAIRDIFQHFSNQSKDEEKTVTIKISYCEIYLEKIYDLLRKDSKEEETFTVMQNGRICSTVNKSKILTQKCVENAEETFDWLKTGNMKRSVGQTKMNEESSRSHAIFQIQIEQEIIETKLIGKLFLVDLAGSENANSGGDIKEGGSIRRGLSTLDRVINALYEKMQNPHRHIHIPHRDSELTLFLKESLGGNSRTAFIFCCSPASCNSKQTNFTLDFGERVKKIKNRVARNEEMTTEKLKETLAKLEKRLEMLRTNKMENGVEEELEKLRMKAEDLEENNYKLKINLEEAETALSNEKQNKIDIEVVIKHMNDLKEEEISKMLEKNEKLAEEKCKIDAELKELNSQIALKNEELDEAKKQIDKNEKECTVLKNTIDDCLKKIEETKEECTKLFEENKILKVENAEKKEVELKMKAENGTLQAENDNLKIQNMRLEMELKTTKINFEENELKQKKVVDDLELKLEESNKIREKQYGQICEMDKNNTQFIHSLLEKDAKIEKLIGQMKENLSKIEEMEGEILAKKNELEKRKVECDGLKNENKKCEGQINELKKQNSDLLAQQGNQMAIFESTIQNNKIQFEKCNEERELQNKRVFELEQQIREELTKNSKLERERKHFEHLRNQSEEQYGKLKNELDGKNAQIDELETKLAEKRTKLEAANVKIGHLQEDCTTLKILQEQMKRDYREQITKQQNDIEKLMAEIEQKNSQIQFFEHQLAIGKEEIEKLKCSKEFNENLVQERNQKIEEILREMQLKIDEQKEISRKLEKYSKQIERELERKENELQNKNREIANFVLQIEELKKEKGKFEMKLNQMKEMNRKREQTYSQYSDLEKETQNEMQRLGETKKMMIDLFKKHLEGKSTVEKGNGGEEKIERFTGKDIQNVPLLNEKFGKIQSQFEKLSEKNKLKNKKLQVENQKLTKELKQMKENATKQENVKRILQQRTARSVSNNQRQLSKPALFQNK